MSGCVNADMYKHGKHVRKIRGRDVTVVSLRTCSFSHVMARERLKMLCEHARKGLSGCECTDLTACSIVSGLDTFKKLVSALIGWNYFVIG